MLFPFPQILLISLPFGVLYFFFPLSYLPLGSFLLFSLNDGFLYHSIVNSLHRSERSLHLILTLPITNLILPLSLRKSLFSLYFYLFGYPSNYPLVFLSLFFIEICFFVDQNHPFQEQDGGGRRTVRRRLESFKMVFIFEILVLFYYYSLSLWCTVGLFGLDLMIMFGWWYWIDVNVCFMN